MWPRFGIKIGNSTVCVATSKEDGNVAVVANKHGNRVSHAILLMDGDDVEVGLVAKQKLTSKAICSVVNNFQLLAKDLSKEQILDAAGNLTCHYDLDKGEYQLMKPRHPGDHSSDEPSLMGTISPYEVCVEFFKASFELARQCHILEEHPNVVLSIPNYYPAESWTLLAEAAGEAGFHVIQVIPEHTAALLAYDHLIKEASSEKRVLCIKSGGLLTSISLFDIEDGLISLVGSAGPFYIGGKQFTDVIKEFICSEFLKKYKLDPRESRRSIAKVKTAAEECKHILTTLASTQICIDSLMDGIDFNVQMSRARYEMLIQSALNEFITTVNQAVQSILSRIESNDVRVKPIDEIVLAGGTMKIPKIQSTIGARFPDAKVNSHLPPDEVVAIGCAAQTLHIVAERRDSLDVSTMKAESEMKCSSIRDDVYLWHGGDNPKQQLVFGKGTLLPAESIVEVEVDDVQLAKDNQATIFKVQIASSIGEIALIGAKPTAGAYKIKATLAEMGGRPKITLLSAA